MTLNPEQQEQIAHFLETGKHDRAAQNGEENTEARFGSHDTVILRIASI